MATAIVDLAKLRADLEQAKMDYARLQQEEADAHQRVNDLTTYIALTERLYPELAPSPVGQPALPAESTAPPTPLAGTGTKEAAIAVLRSTAPRAWKVEELTAEMQRRGWNPDAKQRPVLLVASAMSRLVKSGEHPITKPKYGYYAWVVAPAAPASAGGPDSDRILVS